MAPSPSDSSVSTEVQDEPPKVVTTEEKVAKFTRALRKGIKGTPGILNFADQNGDELVPFDHQRECVRFHCHKTWGLIADDPGLGKTAEFFQLMAAIELIEKGGSDKKGVSAIITAPSSTLPQWLDTALDWMRIPSHQIFVTNHRNDINSVEFINGLRILIISRDCLARCYRACHHYVQHQEQNERGNWKSAWIRTPDTELHPIFQREWTIMGVDEAHYMRNPDTGWCVAHHRLAQSCKRRYALTATPVFNKPLDMVGLMKSINATHSKHNFQDKAFWSTDNKFNTINAQACTLFQEHVYRNRDTILKLPAVIDKTVRFNPELCAENALKYNAILQEARNLKLQIDNSAKKDSKDLQKLMSMMQRLQQMLVSPLLAEKTAKVFKEKPALIDLAIQSPTGALKALAACVKDLFENHGIKRLVVACDYVELMKIGRRYIEKNTDIDGVMFQFDGSLSQQERKEVKRGFLENEKPTILFLSIGAGGTGLHLVGNPSERSAIIFCFSSPFSPAQIRQTYKRIHRIGQAHEVHVRHLVAYGSVDYAIRKGHVCKQNLADYVVDGNKKALGEMAEIAANLARAASKEDQSVEIGTTGCTWKQMGRYVDICTTMDENGNFPPETEEVEAFEDVSMTQGFGSNTRRVAPVKMERCKPPPKHTVFPDQQRIKRPAYDLEEASKRMRLPTPNNRAQPGVSGWGVVDESSSASLLRVAAALSAKSMPAL